MVFAGKIRVLMVVLIVVNRVTCFNSGLNSGGEWLNHPYIM
jgi:hypothetical protein